MKIIFTMFFLLGAKTLVLAQNDLSPIGNVTLGTQGYIGNSLIFNGWGESHFIRNESIGNVANGNTRLRMYLTDDWRYDQGFEIIASRYDGSLRTLLYIPGDGSQTNFFSGASFGGNVGVGTINPLAKLEVAGGNLLVRNITNVDGASSIMVAHSVNINDFDTTGTSIRTITQNAGGNNYGLQFFTEDSWLVGQTEKLRIQGNGNVGIGITNPTNKLDVNGTIHSKEVKVDMAGWSDFVFKKEYNLPTLEEVEKHITEKGHLENIPNEKEVLENGINLGEMNAKLLQKIEEMTLYMIEMKKEMERQNKEIELLKAKK